MLFTLLQDMAPAAATHFNWVELLVGIFGGGALTSLVAILLKGRGTSKEALAQAAKVQAEADKAKLDNITALSDQWQRYAESANKRAEASDNRFADLYKKYLTLKDENVDLKNLVEKLTGKIEEIQKDYTSQLSAMQSEIEALRKMAHV